MNCLEFIGADTVLEAAPHGLVLPPSFHGIASREYMAGIEADPN
jgi:hypothetical protein